MNQPKSIEVSAADIESAIAKGIAELGVSRDEVMYEVLEEPGRRLLGLGVRQARVRVTVIRAPSTPPTAPPTPPAPAVQPVQPAQPVQPVQPVQQPVQQQAPKPVSPAEAPVVPRAEHPRPPRQRPAPKPDSAYVPDFEDEEPESAAPSIPISQDDLAEEARIGAEVLKELLQRMDIVATVEASPSRTDGKEAQHWTLELHGRELGALIGRRGETLSALQYLTRLVTSRRLGRRANLVVDVEGYKSRREAMLQRLANRMAEQAVQRGRTVSLEPMPPHERRIIHMALRDNPDVTTESVGEGDRRKVTVVPRRQKP